jgi:hypothetical protein
VSKQLLFGWMWRATTARTTCAVGINDRVPGYTVQPRPMSVTRDQLSERFPSWSTTTTVALASACRAQQAVERSRLSGDERLAARLFEVVSVVR